MFSSSRYFLTALEDTLSMVLKTGLKPLFVKYVMVYLKVSIVDVSFKYFTGVARITFDDQSYKSNIAVFASIDLIANFPVKSTYMVPFFGFSVAWYANRSFYLSIAIDGCRYLFVPSITNTVLIFSLVLQIPYFCLFMWPLSVSGSESGRYFWTARAVNLGSVENCLLLITFSSVCFG